MAEKKKIIRGYQGIQKNTFHRTAVHSEVKIENYKIRL